MVSRTQLTRGEIGSIISSVRTQGVKDYFETKQKSRYKVETLTETKFMSSRYLHEPVALLTIRNRNRAVALTLHEQGLKLSLH